MSNSQKMYRAEAIEYLEDLDVVTHGLWRDLARYGLKYTKVHQANWTTIKTLNTFAKLYFEKQESNVQDKKLKDFAPGVSKAWKKMCRHSERKTKLRIQIEYLNSQRILKKLVENAGRRTI